MRLQHLRCEVMNVKLNEFEFMPREVATRDDRMLVLTKKDSSALWFELAHVNGDLSAYCDLHRPQLLHSQSWGRGLLDWAPELSTGHHCPSAFGSSFCCLKPGSGRPPLALGGVQVWIV